MPKRRRPPRNNPLPAGGTGEPDLPSFLELDRFSRSSLHQWRTAATRLEALQRSLYFALEPLRQQSDRRLIDAIRAGAGGGFALNDWSRVVDYRYALEPLSVAGSLRGNGGRFNIGSALSPSTFTPFPALYVADDYDTAHLERFGSARGGNRSGLTSAELALRRPNSFVQLRLRGTIETVFDVGDLASLQPIVDIIKDFQLPKSVAQTARKLGLRQAPWLIRSTITLQRQLLTPNWRMLPIQFDLPSNSQIFGRLAAAAGMHGILFPSSRDSTHRCLALFPQNWAASTSFVEVVDPVPSEARAVRIDGKGRPFGTVN